MSNVDHPKHYNSHPSGIEAVDLCELLSFNLGNAVKYLMRADHKGARAEDLKKAAWYLRREAKRMGNEPMFCSKSRGLCRAILAHEGDTHLANLLAVVREGTIYGASLVRVADDIDPP